MTVLNRIPADFTCAKSCYEAHRYLHIQASVMHQLATFTFATRINQFKINELQKNSLSVFRWR